MGSSVGSAYGSKSVRARNARLAISILQKGLKEGRIAAAQKAAIVVLSASSAVPETVTSVRFNTPSTAVLARAKEFEPIAEKCLSRD